MRFFDKITDKLKNFDYEKVTNSIMNELEHKQESIEKRVREETRKKAKTASDEQLQYNLEKAKANGNYIMLEEIEKEMDRRGIYY